MGKPRSTTSSYIIKAQAVHKKFYDYSKAVYSLAKNKITIICPIHGDFQQRPDMHLSGQLCPKCGQQNRIHNHKYTTEEFIQLASKIHQNKYKYDDSIYKSNNTNIIIFCLKKNHGYFSQTPRSHLQGIGCPMCRESKGEIEIRKVLISQNVSFQGQYRTDKCKYKMMLPFDFALIDKLKQPIGMIEFNGTQHYQPSDFSSKKSLEEVQKDFEIRVTRDKIKREYCEKNNIPLLIIPYKSKNNIEQLVNSFVKNCIDRIKQ